MTVGEEAVMADPVEPVRKGHAAGSAG
jgi:hypothetical protein